MLRQWTVASWINRDDINQAWQFHNKCRERPVIELLAVFYRLSQVFVEGAVASKLNLIERFDVQSIFPRIVGHPFKSAIGEAESVVATTDV